MIYFCHLQYGNKKELICLTFYKGLKKDNYLISSKYLFKVYFTDKQDFFYIKLKLFYTRYKNIRILDRENLKFVYDFMKLEINDQYKFAELLKQNNIPIGNVKYHAENSDDPNGYCTFHKIDNEELN